MQAASSMQASKSKQKLGHLAQWLEQEYPSTASSLLEGSDDLQTSSLNTQDNTDLICTQNNDHLARASLFQMDKTSKEAYLRARGEHRPARCSWAPMPTCCAFAISESTISCTLEEIRRSFGQSHVVRSSFIYSVHLTHFKIRSNPNRQRATKVLVLSSREARVAAHGRLPSE